MWRFFYLFVLVKCDLKKTIWGFLDKQNQTSEDAILVRGDMYNWRFLLSSGIF